MKKIIFVASILLLISCENKERLDEIKAELKSAKKVSKKSENEQKKVSFSAPPQNEKIEAPVETYTDDSEEYSEENSDYNSYDESDYDSGTEYGD